MEAGTETGFTPVESESRVGWLEMGRETGEGKRVSGALEETAESVCV